MNDKQALMDAIAEIAKEAGEAILGIYDRTAVEVVHKADESPLTEADLAAHRIILGRLGDLTPEIPVLSEESEGISWEERRHWSRCWIVDPLDGTKEFIKRNGEFTVNIALVEDHRPVLGVVHVPVTGVTYLGAQNEGAWKESAGVRKAIQVRSTGSPVVMVASRSHGTDTIGVLETSISEHLGPVELTSMGSSLKLCLVAEGVADIYPRLAPTSEWDTAAAHAVVCAAGGRVVTTRFRELDYNNKADILNPHFLVLGDAVARWQFLKDVL